MAKLSKLKYMSFDKEEKTLNFLPKSSREGCEFTVITGVNGSQKSTILREIVEKTLEFKAMGHPAGPLIFLNFDANNTNIIATSGALADRYPSKRMPNKPSLFDDPSYIYLGQRVGTNLLSKKNSLENLVFHLLTDSKPERFKTPCFTRLFKTVGLLPEVNCTFQFRSKRSSKKDSSLPSISLFDHLQNIVTDRFSSNRQDGGKYVQFSKMEAVFLLNEFDYEIFGDLHELSSGRSKVSLRMFEDEINSTVASEVIRLGLISEECTLMEAQVTSRSQGKRYSIYDLSSGEFHFLFNILGIGFASNDQSIILLDEPENSLHPKWQIEFMDMLAELSVQVTNGHIVIATHSPLIVSSAPQYSNIIDLATDFEFNKDLHSLYGASTDEILVDHFGLASTRNFYFVNLLQEAVEMFSNGLTDGEEYSKKMEELRSCCEIKLKV